MGCDIHLFSEVRPSRTLIQKLLGIKTKWICADRLSKNEDYPDYSKREFTVNRKDSFYTSGRNYNLFSALAGVRSQHFSNKVTPISEPKGIPKDVSEFVQAEIEDYGSDGHSHSYLSIDEILQYDFSEWGDTCLDFLNEVVPKMANLKMEYEDVRIVFFFDN